MAESFVSDVADSLLGKLASYAYEEASRAYGVYDDLQRFKDTLSIVKGVLLDAEETKDKKHGLREWLRQIKNICYDAEDVLDGFEFQNKRHFFSSHNSLVFRLRMAHQIKDVRDRLDKVVVDGNRFGLERRNDVDPRLVMQKREMTYSHVDASDVIGRENDREEIVQLLMQPHPDGDGDDDIWNDDRAKWIELKDLIKVGAIGSKILVTTRSNSIASMMGTIDPYVLKGLSPENCLSLFVKWAFKEEQKEDGILSALKLSYDQMPSHLRHCFTYFSLFPKDYNFDGQLMTTVWLGHGLLQAPDGSQKTNDIAREYIDELYSRSFIQDFKVFGHTAYRFKVHDLVHDLAMYVAKEEFVVVDSHTQNIAEQVRHLSIFKTDSLGHALFPKSRSVRTILFPIGGVGLDSETIFDSWLSRHKYLRFLDLSDSSFETLPNSIAELEHLRTLILSRNHKIKRLPHSICKLHNLQCLSLYGCMELETLPKGLGKLISLRELYITTKQSVKYVIEGQKPNPTVSEPNPKIEVGNSDTWGFPELQILPQWIKGATGTLETLIIANFHNLKILPECLTIMTHLKRLRIYNCPQLLSLPRDMHRLTAHLEELRIIGCPKNVSRNLVLVAHSRSFSGREKMRARKIMRPSIEEGDAKTTVNTTP
ncbi:Winged helix-like DNA-binding domain superfamily [Sesbania bispinosa]|nr:Winged helix-like DNA-binding domain superfamily [Sesbania bispinosa]